MFLLKPKFIIPLAVVSGLVASYGVYRYLEQVEQNMKPEIVSQPVVVANENLSLGTTLSWQNLEVKQWPEEILPEGTFSDAKFLQGRVLKTDITHGEPILLTKLAPEGSSGGVSSLIPPGMRAVTVAVNVVSGVGGFILPKTRVDVLATIALAKREQVTTKMILQNVRVLAVDQTFKKDDDNPMTVQSVTMLVSPQNAEKLALAASEGKLQLTLRNTTDKKLQETKGVRLSQLINQSKPPKRVRKRTSNRTRARVTKKPTVVEVIRASERTEVTFEDDGKKGTN